MRPVKPGPFALLDEAQFIAGDTDLVAVEVVGLKTARLRWSGRLELSSARVTDLVADEWRAPGLSLVDVLVEHAEVVSLSAVEGGWRDVEIQQSRLGSLEVYGSTWDCVHFVGCKLGYVNLRASTIRDVAFTDCVIDELDLMGATASRVAFGGSRIGRLEPHASVFTDVDLREAHLSDLGSVEGLRGATVTIDQLLDLAPLLALRLGIRIE